jgi:hypothetical protein
MRRRTGGWFTFLWVVSRRGLSRRRERCSWRAMIRRSLLELVRFLPFFLVFLELCDAHSFVRRLPRRRRSCFRLRHPSRRELASRTEEPHSRRLSPSSFHSTPLSYIPSSTSFRNAQTRYNRSPSVYAAVPQERTRLRPARGLSFQLCRTSGRRLSSDRCRLECPPVNSRRQWEPKDQRPTLQRGRRESPAYN